MGILGVTGGIGSGKTAVTDYLLGKGVTIVDADVVAREVVEPGTPAFRALVDGFGRAILNDAGALDRAFLASRAFSSAEGVARLNRITHGAIGLRLRELVHGAETEHVVVALPLFRPEHRKLLSLDWVWSLEVDPDVAIMRLVAHRSFSLEDARARIGAQITNAERRLIVDEVLVNAGSLDELLVAVDDAWLNFVTTHA